MGFATTLVVTMAFPALAGPPTPGKPSPAPAEAPSAPSDRAAQLKAEGDAAMGDFRYADALAKYEEARTLTGNPALEYNAGRALEMLARYPEALERLRSFKARATAELLARVPNLDALIADVERRTTLLTVKVARPGATIRLGDRVLGTSPLPPTRVNSGKAVTVRVALEGHDEETRTVELPGGGEATVEVTPIPKDRRATLIVDSPVKGASLRVDGIPRGNVPSELALVAGVHSLELSAQGYDPIVSEVTLAAGERRRVALEPGSSAIYKRWWFWTLLGTAAAGGAVTAVLLVEKPADVGTIAPGQVVVEGRGSGAPPVARGGLFVAPLPIVDVRF